MFTSISCILYLHQQTTNFIQQTPDRDNFMYLLPHLADFTDSASEKKTTLGYKNCSL